MSARKAAINIDNKLFRLKIDFFFDNSSLNVTMRNAIIFRMIQAAPMDNIKVECLSKNCKI